MIKNGYQLTLIANIEKSISINFMERKLISTGIFIQFPKKIKYHFFLKKKFIEAICVIHITKNKKNTVLCQEIKMIITNVLFETMKIRSNEKLAVVNIFQGTQIKWEKCSILNTSMRGCNSFGSTGI
ncbi:dCTP deaminase/dUTPase family protein [Blattabacterium cuenoti]|uniref:dUTP diphosphatase n=1 Tax=Blattabacterium cuenoti TaxID=1653831 RepID=UPI00163B6DCC|nr:dUTP diphosphatase [Blattabacterium cuenoti]